MHRVVVRFDKAEEKKSIKLTGWTEEMPRVGRDFCIKVQQDGYPTFHVDFGRISNIRWYGNLLLVQTDKVVAEVQIASDEQENQPNNVLPFLRPGQMKIKNGKVQGRRKKGPTPYLFKPAGRHERDSNA